MAMNIFSNGQPHPHTSAVPLLYANPNYSLASSKFKCVNSLTKSIDHSFGGDNPTNLTAHIINQSTLIKPKSMGGFRICDTIRQNNAFLNTSKPPLNLLLKKKKKNPLNLLLFLQLINSFPPTFSHHPLPLLVLDLVHPSPPRHFFLFQKNAWTRIPTRFAIFSLLPRQCPHCPST